MKIAVIGAGAMGSIYGGRLSQKNDVFMIDKIENVVNTINQDGITLVENGEDHVFHPKAGTSSEGLGEMDLIILFVKALWSKAALEENKALIGPNTYVMTLQNGSGHEDILKEFCPLYHIVIGTTEDNGAILGAGKIRHGGVGKTNIGMLTDDTEGFLNRLKATLDEAGFKALIHDNIQQLIWDKLFTNISLSAVTGILGVKMGFIAGNEHAWNMTKQLVSEAMEVAHAMGLSFDEKEMLERIHKTSEANPEGETSIYADLKNGRRTEVDTISGSVVRAAKKYNVAVPTHTFLVEMVHAMEGRN